MKQTSGLVTDFYELTMIQGYYLEENNPQVVFDMFYRSQPFTGGYAIFAGLETLLEQIQQYRFSDEDIQFLREQGCFQEVFLSYLKEFRFTGDIYSMQEGTAAFPGEPLLRVHGSLIETQIIESLLLNIINFQTLIATKASRIYVASKGGKILEFGLRRAQGLDGALSAARAAYIGGASATSNTLAGKTFGIPVKGTMAHSWVMSFSNELDSFTSFARHYPDNCILLIDTYDTLYSGLPNAVTVGKEMKKQGKRIGVRIDSGDLSYLSRKVRTALDAAGLEDASITVSNDLNEEIITQLINDHAPIDFWGVGTHLVTGGTQAALSGVYKLSARCDNGRWKPTMKLSNNIEKTTHPGIKQVYRFFYKNEALADLITLEDEPVDAESTIIFHHPMSEEDFFLMKPSHHTRYVPLLSCTMKGGKPVEPRPSLNEIKSFAQSQLDTLEHSHKRILNPHIYKVSISEKLRDVKTAMIRTYRRTMSRH